MGILNKLSFYSFIEKFHQSTVIRISLSTFSMNSISILQHLKIPASKLSPLIGMNNQTGFRMLLPIYLIKCRNNKLIFPLPIQQLA